LRHPFSYRRNGATPGWRSFGQLNRKRSRQSTVTVSLFKKPLALESLALNPIQYIRVNQGPHRFHDIKG
jgi:hypothetical protein